MPDSIADTDEMLDYHAEIFEQMRGVERAERYEKRIVVVSEGEASINPDVFNRVHGTLLRVAYCGVMIANEGERFCVRLMVDRDEIENDE